MDRQLSLADLAARINSEHDACIKAAHRTLDHALEAGRLLVQAKQRIGHGSWLSWLKESCGIKERTAQVYMRLARELPKLDPANAQRVADLSFRQAIAALSRDVKTLGSFREVEQAKLLDTVETERVHFLPAAKRMKRALRPIPAPPVSAPSCLDDGRRFEMLGREADRSICVAVHPNEAGRKLAAIAEEIGASLTAPLAAARLAKLEEAERLEQRAREFRDEAAELLDLEREQLKAEIEARHGPAYHFAETHSFKVLDDGLWRKLKAVKQADLPARLLAEVGRGRVSFERSDYWGDMDLLGLSANGGESLGAKWTGIGSIDNFEAIMSAKGCSPAGVGARS
jgi:hypothetical protein